MKTIALCMIVKNEAGIIARCFESVLPLIDYILIVDTGSTDGTQAAVREFLRSKNIAGDVIDEPWRDFAYNRTFALQKIRERGVTDYSLMIDADQIITWEPDFDVAKFKNELRHDLYDVRLRTGNIEYLVPQLASNNLDVSYRGVVHEFRECPHGCSRGIAQGLVIREVHDGARSLNQNKYADDAAAFARALATETDPFLKSRYTFYLAQSYRDAGQPEPALKAYLERTELGGWVEEIFYSFYAAAKLMEILNYPDEEIIKTYLDAHRASPTRAEALHGAARLCRKIQQYDRGYKLVRQALRLPCPPRGLFVEPWIYDYGLLDELSDLACSSGRYAESVDACLEILAQGRIPEDQRDRVRQNAHFAVNKLGAAPMAAAAPSSPAALTPSTSQFSDLAAATARPAAATSRYAIVTPYYKESRATLERCLNSVRRQSVPVDHILVSDGFPQQWIDDEPVRHVRLDTAHGDFGNTPRGLGALMAVADGYDGIGVLDADNWLARNHVEECVAAAAAHDGPCDVVIAKRMLMTPDERPLPALRDEHLEHVDTNCFFFLRGSYHMLHHWVLLPKPLSPFCDRFFYAAVRNYQLRSAPLAEPTVFYECLWSAVYEAAGLPPPPNAKPNVEAGPIWEWLGSLSDDELRFADKRAGVPVRGTLAGMGTLTKGLSRNALCPCGSGKRYKHCHGAVMAPS